MARDPASRANQLATSSCCHHHDRIGRQGIRDRPWLPGQGAPSCDPERSQLTPSCPARQEFLEPPSGPHGRSVHGRPPSRHGRWQTPLLPDLFGVGTHHPCEPPGARSGPSLPSGVATVYFLFRDVREDQVDVGTHRRADRCRHP